MKLSSLGIALVVVCLFSGPAVRAQAQSSGNQNVSAASVTVVPRLIKFSGTLLDAQNKPIATGPVGVTFALYAEQTGGASLWLETQNVRPDENGYYTVLIGSETSTGVSMELFASGEARWLGIQIERQPEQARVLLVSVPYALKAGDAETIGGLPPSAFVLANQARSAGGESKTGESDSASVASVSSTSMSKKSKNSAVVISGLTPGVIPQAGSATTIVNSSPQCDTTTNSGMLTCAGNIVAGSTAASGVLESYNTTTGGVLFGSGSWFGNVGYMRPAGTNEAAFDVVSHGGTTASPSLAWEDICPTDVVADTANYICLDLGWKNAGYATLSTVHAGTGTFKNLAIQDQQGGFVSVGTHAAFPYLLYINGMGGETNLALGATTSASPAGTPGTAGTILDIAGTAPTGASGMYAIWPDSTANWWSFANKNGTKEPIAGVNGSITATHCAEFKSTTEIGDSGVVCSSSGMVYPGTGVPVSTGSAWSTSLTEIGSDTGVLTAGTISGGAGTGLCLDSNGGQTTSGCASANNVNAYSPTTGYSTTSEILSTAGQTAGFAFVAQFPGSYGHILVRVATADNSANTYNLGIYNSSGSLICSSGAIAGSTINSGATGTASIAMTSNCVLTAGAVYWMAASAVTTSTLKIEEGDEGVIAHAIVSISSSTSMPSSFSPPSLTYTFINSTSAPYGIGLIP